MRAGPLLMVICLAACGGDDDVADAATPSDDAAIATDAQPATTDATPSVELRCDSLPGLVDEVNTSVSSTAVHLCVTSTECFFVGERCADPVVVFTNSPAGGPTLAIDAMAPWSVTSCSSGLSTQTGYENLPEVVYMTAVLDDGDGTSYELEFSHSGDYWLFSSWSLSQ